MHYFPKEVTAVVGSTHQVVIPKKMPFIVRFLLLYVHVYSISGIVMSMDVEAHSCP